MTRRSTPRLYDPAFEHDSCGFGLLVNIDGRASRWLVDQAFAALAKMAHRGGVNADGVTGDGCGILLYRPEAWLRALADEAHIAVGTRFAAGLVFLPHDADRAAAARAQFERLLREEGLAAAGWRAVPLADEACGPLGLAHRPRIEQLFANAPDRFDRAAFERALFRARRRAEQALAHEAAFYVVSLSAATIGYKAMAAPGRLHEVFPDLQRPASPCARPPSTSASPPTPCPTGSWPSPSACSPTTARSTPSAPTAPGSARAPKLRSPLLELSDLGPPVSTAGSGFAEPGQHARAAGRRRHRAHRRAAASWCRRPMPRAKISTKTSKPSTSTTPCTASPGTGRRVWCCDARCAACTARPQRSAPGALGAQRRRPPHRRLEAGLWDVPEERILAKGRLGPARCWRWTSPPTACSTTPPSTR